MFKFIIPIAGLAALSFAIVVYAVPPTPSGTIAIAPGSDLNLGGVATFNVTYSDLPASTPAKVAVVCYQGEETVFVASQSNVETSASFLLGGASSDWLINTGPAECEARLYYAKKQPPHEQVILDTVWFTAGG